MKVIVYKSKVMGKTILVQELVVIPEGVTVDIKAGYIRVKGKRGEIYKRIPKAQVLYRRAVEKKKQVLKIQSFIVGRKRQACPLSLAKFVRNLIKGVTVGFEYKLRYGFNILPARPVAIEKGAAFEISNYMGQKDTHVIKCPAGVTVRNHEDPKIKEIYVSGIDVSSVGQMGMIHFTQHLS